MVCWYQQIQQIHVLLTAFHLLCIDGFVARREKIVKRRLEKLSKNMFIFLWYKSRVDMQTIRDLGKEFFKYPSYSSDLAALDHLVFLQLTKSLQGQKFFSSPKALVASLWKGECAELQHNLILNPFFASTVGWQFFNTFLYTVLQMHKFYLLKHFLCLLIQFSDWVKPLQCSPSLRTAWWWPFTFQIST